MPIRVKRTRNRCNKSGVQIRGEDGVLDDRGNITGHGTDATGNVTGHSFSEDIFLGCRQPDSL